MHTVAKGPVVGPGASSEELPELDEDDEATMHFGQAMMAKVRLPKAVVTEDADTFDDEATSAFGSSDVDVIGKRGSHIATVGGAFEDEATAVGMTDQPATLGFDDETIVKPPAGIFEALRAAAPPAPPIAAPKIAEPKFVDEPSFDDATLVRAMPGADEPAMPLLLQRRKDGGPASVPPPAPRPAPASLPLPAPRPAPASLAPRPSPPPSNSRLSTTPSSPPASSPNSAAAELTSLLPARAETRSNSRIFVGILCVLVATAAGLGLGHFAAKRNSAQDAQPANGAQP